MGPDDGHSILKGFCIPSRLSIDGGWKDDLGSCMYLIVSTNSVQQALVLISADLLLVAASPSQPLHLSLGELVTGVLLQQPP